MTNAQQAQQFHLGYQPAYFTLHLTGGSDFLQSLTTLDGAPYPPGTAIALQIDDLAPWPATIVGGVASWNVDRDVVDAVSRRAQRARLLYSDGAGVDVVWMTGTVQWDDD